MIAQLVAIYLITIATTNKDHKNIFDCENQFIPELYHTKKTHFRLCPQISLKDRAPSISLPLETPQA